MKNLLRAATISVASIALVAGGATAATAAPGDGVSVTPVKLAAGATYYKTSNVVRGAIGVAGLFPGRNSYVTATVNVNGRAVANDVHINTGGSGGFYFNRAWGAGIVSLTNFKVSGYDSTDAWFYERPVPSVSNSTRVRYAVESGSGVKVTKRGKKMTFKLTATYRDKAEKRKSALRATIQVKKGSKWKSLKTVKLNSKGKATYKRSDKKKRFYRMVVKTTNTLQGGNTKGLKI